MNNQTRNQTHIIHRIKLLQELLNSELGEEAKIRVETGIQYCEWFLGTTNSKDDLWYNKE